MCMEFTKYIYSFHFTKIWSGFVRGEMLMFSNFLIKLMRLSVWIKNKPPAHLGAMPKVCKRLAIYVRLMEVR